jgi:hypothetical protein
LTLLVEGTPAVDVFLLPEFAASQMIDAYVRGPGPLALGAPARLSERVDAGSMWQRSATVPPGIYYVFLDHSAAAGTATPPREGSSAPARVDYLVQLGDAP